MIQWRMSRLFGHNRHSNTSPLSASNSHTTIGLACTANPTLVRRAFTGSPPILWPCRQDPIPDGNPGSHVNKAPAFLIPSGLAGSRESGVTISIGMGPEAHSTQSGRTADTRCIINAQLSRFWRAVHFEC
jgi:hypothetical protein